MEADNYFLTKVADWRKKAAMTAVSDADIEKAFADQASGFVENKLEPLMKAPYHIGFEVVRKNDDNTRLIGIFAFTVDKKLLFAPVFFLNGEIKGPLLYRCDTKTFVPANKEWATYLISSIEDTEGKGISRDRRGDSAPLVQMQRINFMSNGGPIKRASVSASVNKPLCTCKDYATRFDGNGIVVIAQPDYRSSATWNNRLPGGESLLKMAAADDGTIRCSFGDECFMLSAKDGNFIADSCGGSQVHTPDGVVLNLDQVATQRVKTAFFDNVPDYRDQWDFFMKQAAVDQAQIGILRDFLKEADYGQPAAEALIKAAEDREFAEALAECYPSPADLFPTEFATTKTAAAKKDEGELLIKYAAEDLPDNPRIKSEYFRDGFYILDSRPQDTLSVVVEETPVGMNSISEAGAYNVLNADGTFEKDVFVAPYENWLPVARNVIHDDNFRTKSHLHKKSVIAIKYGKLAVTNELILGHKTGMTAKDAAVNVKDSVSKGGIYVVAMDNAAYGPVCVEDASTVDGVQYIDVRMIDVPNLRESAFDDYKGYVEGSTYSIVYNKDAKRTDWGRRVLGSDVTWIKLGNKSDYIANGCATADFPALSVAVNGNVDTFISSAWNLPTVKITKDHVKNAGYIFSDGEQSSARMNRCEALVKLARDMAISGQKAYDLLQKADTTGEVKFYLDPIEKVAMRLRVVDRPNFDDEFDSEFGVPLQPAKAYNLRIQGDEMFEPPSAIGDMMNPTTVTGLPNATVVSTKPEDLRALADTYKLPHVFEHSVVGTLADTFDANVLMDKYIARIEDAVDALFRTLFLLYWRPGDFEKVYGVDDMPNFEAETLSNCDSLGAMLLRLLKKTDAYKKGVSFNRSQESSNL